MAFQPSMTAGGSWNAGNTEGVMEDRTCHGMKERRIYHEED